jgi:predicted amidophosphoribosyltransferase
MDYSKRIDFVLSYRIFGLYEGALRDCLLAIKFHNSKGLALRLGGILKRHLTQYVEELSPDLITFPALNLRRYWSRGFNHMEYVLKGAGLPHLQVFERKDLSPPLARLKGRRREKAVMGYSLRKEFIDFLHGKRVLIVDDVLTTGSTLSRLASLLLSVGVKEVHVYLIAKD